MKIEIVWPERKGLKSWYISRKRPNFNLSLSQNNLFFVVVFCKDRECWISNLCNVTRLEKCLGYKNQNTSCK